MRYKSRKSLDLSGFFGFFSRLWPKVSRFGDLPDPLPYAKTVPSSVLQPASRKRRVETSRFLLAEARARSFLTLLYPGPLTGPGGETLEHLFRPCGNALPLWTDRYEIEDFVGKRGPSPWEKIVPCSFVQAEEMLRRYPFAYQGILIDPDQLHYPLGRDEI